MEGYHNQKPVLSYDYHEGNPLLSYAYHRPVLLGEVLDALKIGQGWYLDATLGDGGHSLEILRLGGKIVGIDVDPEAIERAGRRFESLGIDKSRYLLIQGNFRDIDSLIQIEFDGVVFDLGVSSLQLDTPSRGFSFSKDSPLDMRMIQSYKLGPWIF